MSEKIDLKGILRTACNIPDEEKISLIKIFTERERTVVIDEAGDGSLLVDPKENHHLAQLDAIKDSEEEHVITKEIDGSQHSKPKRKYTRRAPVVPVKPKKKGKRGRKFQFDIEGMDTTKVSEAKVALERQFRKGNLLEIEKDIYLNICHDVDVEDLPIGKKDKIVSLYKRVGTRLMGGDEE